MRPLFVEGSHAAFRAALFEDLASLGVDARVADRPGPAWDAARDAGEDDMFLLGWTADYPDADAFTHGLLHSTRGWLGRFCGMPEIDRLIERSRTATDVDLRHDLYREVESLVARHALLLPLFNARTVRFARPEVHGLEVTFAPPFVHYDRIWVER
jgi:peptide/nickel transport system substrate-binding protein/oligopeptide transport system substrate-binding protein